MSGSPGKGPLMWGWGLAVEKWHLRALRHPVSLPPRLDLSDMPNSVRLVAPDVGILLVSSLCLCLCRRLVPKASAAARSHRPESLEPLERVRATPSVIGGVPSSASPQTPEAQQLVPVLSPGRAALAWGHP